MNNKKNVLGTPNLLRIMNRNVILSLLSQLDISSRAELSDLSGLSPPTVSAITKELLDEGWLHHVGDGVSQGGKPRQLLKMNQDARYVGAIQMNREKIRIRITNLIGTVVAEEQFKIGSVDSQAICKEAARRFWDLLISQQMDPQILLGVGVVVPGVVNGRGFVSNAPEFGWDREPIKEYLLNEFENRFLVWVENDVKLAAMGDAWKRKALSGISVYVHLDRGIGAGILIDGKLFKGSKFAAGEIGNMIVDSKTQIASKSSGQAGSFGIFEHQYGLAALSMSERNAEEASFREEWIVTHIAYAIVNVIALLDPDTIVFGGAMTARIDNFLGKISNVLFGLVESTPRMYITPLGDDASLIGAVIAVIENYTIQVKLNTL